MFRGKGPGLKPFPCWLVYRGLKPAANPVEQAKAKAKKKQIPCGNDNQIWDND